MSVSSTRNMLILSFPASWVLAVCTEEAGHTNWARFRKQGHPKWAGFQMKKGLVNFVITFLKLFLSVLMSYKCAKSAEDSNTFPLMYACSDWDHKSEWFQLLKCVENKLRITSKL